MYIFCLERKSADSLPEQRWSKFTLAEFPFLFYFALFNDKSDEWETEFHAALTANQFFLESQNLIIQNSRTETAYHHRGSHTAKKFRFT